MKQLMLPTMALCLLSSAVFADGFSVEKTYSFHQQDHSQKDAACISAFVKNVTPEFRGLTGLQLLTPTIADITSGALATYPNVTFSALMEMRRVRSVARFQRPTRHPLTSVLVLLVRD